MPSTTNPNAPFEYSAELTAVANAYTNEAFIAEMVVPHIRVNQEIFEYATIPKGTRFTIPDTYVGRMSQPNQVEFSQTLTESRVVDYALDSPVPSRDVLQAPEGVNPEAFAAEHVAELIMLSKEQKVSAMVFNANNYAAANKATLSGTSQWSHSSSDPVKAILTAMDGMIMRPNTMVIGQEVLTQLILHPKLVAAYQGNEGAYGKIPGVAWLANYFGLQRVFVGQAWYNATTFGQDPSISRLWGKHAALLHYRPNAIPGKATTWGGVFYWPQGGSAMFSGRINDPDMGARGGVRVRVGMSYKELVIASDFGYLFVNAVA